MSVARPYTCEFIPRRYNIVDIVYEVECDYTACSGGTLTSFPLSWTFEDREGVAQRKGVDDVQAALRLSP